MIRKILDRLLKLENRKTEDIKARFPDDSDGFVSALGVDPSRFAVRSGDYYGFDFLTALEETSVQDWKDYF